MTAAKKTIAALFAVFMLTGYAAAAENFICTKCWERIVQKHRPNPAYCKAGGHHMWYQLGPTGPMIHICLKCRLRVNTAGRPHPAYCKAGGHHMWHLLGHRGKDNYGCRKCHLKVRTAGRPNPAYCEAGGHHDWIRF